MMHIDNHLTEVQADARTVDMEATRVTTLIEAVEDVLLTIAVESDTCIDDLECDVSIIVSQPDVNLSVVEAVLEGIREQIGDDLVELSAVNPYVHLLDALMYEVELNATFLGIILEHLADALYEIDEVSKERMELLTRQMAKREDTTEVFKAADQMEWVRRMNSIRNRAEEMIMRELIYTEEAQDADT